MSFHVAFYFAASAIILTQTAIESVNGQCTTEGCGHDDLSMNIITEIQEQNARALSPLNKQIQNIHDLLTSQQDVILKSLQAVDRRLEEHDVYIKQGQHFHELLNSSFQEMKSQHETVNKKFQAVDRRLLEQSQSIHDRLNESFQEMTCQQGTVMTSLQEIVRRSQEHNNYVKQVSSVHEHLNESLEEMKGQHGTVITKLLAVDRRFQEHNICIKQRQDIQELLNASFQEMKSQHETVNKSFQAVDRRLLEQSQSIHVLLNESFQEMKNLQAVDRRSYEQDVCINQVLSIHEFLNESIQPTKSQHDTVRTSLQELDRLSQEHNIYIKQVPIIYELLNKSFQQMRSQFDAVEASLQTVDRNLENYQKDINNQTEKSWKLVNDIWDAVLYPVRDCSDLKARGHTTNGVYEVCVGHQTKRVCANAYCDMETTNGASLVFQRRKDGSVNFNRTWAEYKEGFGNSDGEFWLGNEMLYLLTYKRNYKLRIDLEDFNGRKRYAEYSYFSISSSADNYRLTVGEYSGNAGDSLSYHNRRQFSTIDVDNDESGSLHCAQTFGGAWWHRSCTHCALNGKYYQRYDTVISYTGIQWQPLAYHAASLKATEMKLVPVA